MRVLICSKTFAKTFLILRLQRDMFIQVYRYSRKEPVVLVRYQRKVDILAGFSKNI
jgi:hypothetical protein